MTLKDVEKLVFETKKADLESAMNEAGVGDAFSPDKTKKEIIQSVAEMYELDTEEAKTEAPIPAMEIAPDEMVEEAPIEAVEEAPVIEEKPQSKNSEIPTNVTLSPARLEAIRICRMNLFNADPSTSERIMAEIKRLESGE